MVRPCALASTWPETEIGAVGMPFLCLTDFTYLPLLYFLRACPRPEGRPPPDRGIRYKCRILSISLSIFFDVMPPYVGPPSAFRPPHCTPRSDLSPNPRGNLVPSLGVLTCAAVPRRARSGVRWRYFRLRAVAGCVAMTPVCLSALAPLGSSGGEPWRVIDQY